MANLYSDGLDDFAKAQEAGSSSPTAIFTARRGNKPSASQDPFTIGSDPFLPVQNRNAGPRATNGHSATPVVHGIPLVSLRQALPDRFRTIFPYELLNAVQSKCFEAVYHTNDNVIVSAPTGSGKTAILELGICKLALDRGNENFKIVYQAPTKALCSERARDWEKKFNHMNLKCAELTGDTSQAEMRRVGDAAIIVTTPEKWDSITRKWQDHRRLLQMVELFLIDEVHILKDGRGATLEAVVSRMKTIGANVRFLALSATVPNSDDIARWLGRDHTNQQLPAHRETFGEEFRPVKLQKFVYGFESKGNDYIFDKFLDQKLPGLVHKHSQRKPTLVFCFTRKSCESTAAMLAEFASARPDGDRVWPTPSQRVPVISRELQEIVRFGVAFHHAGLDAQDRAAVEQNFLKGQLGVICCTSTLAVGINLPCHTVVLKGTVGFASDKLEEYSDLEVMQMLGRAGRPQFDDSATAIILTRAAHKERYQKMVSGQQILESTLHLNLIEHLNSEICLGTITDVSSAKAWLGGTFLSLTGTTTSPALVDDKLEEICERDIKHLQEAELVTGDSSFRCTEYGRAMSKYMVQFQTMKLLLQIPRGVGMETLITILSQASEFKEFRFKPAERQLFREVNQSPLIMYPVKEVVTQTWHKVSLMVQVQLGCAQYPDTSEAAKAKRQLMMERKLVFERLNRLVRAVIDCKGHDRDAIGTKTALELARALAAESWEGRATQLTQVPNIGPVGMRKLVSKDIRTVLQLSERSYDEIERLMSRQPPFGKTIQAHLDKFPRLTVRAEVVGHRVYPKAEAPVVIQVNATIGYTNQKAAPHWLNRPPALTFLAETKEGTLVYFWRGSIRKLDSQAGFDLKFSVDLCSSEDVVTCHFTCEEIVGTIVSTTVDHNIPASVFPTRPPSKPTLVNRTSSAPKVKETAQSYLEVDDIDDLDLILAAEQAVAKFSKEHPKTDEIGYPPVEELVDRDRSRRDEFDNHLAGHDVEERTRSAQIGIAESEPVRLPNGKWQCNHPCTGGTVTRSGKPCTHRCCRDGLDKPPKRAAQRRKRQAEETTDAFEGLERPRTSPQPQSPTLPQSQQATQSKRKRLHDAQPLTKSSSFMPINAVKTQHSSWDALDIDDLDCIDLSFTDDESDLIVKRPVTVSSSGDGNLKHSPQGARGAGSETGNNPSSTQVRETVPPERKGLYETHFPTQGEEFKDDDLDDYLEAENFPEVQRINPRRQLSTSSSTMKADEPPAGKGTAELPGTLIGDTRAADGDMTVATRNDTDSTIPSTTITLDNTTGISSTSLPLSPDVVELPGPPNKSQDDPSVDKSRAQAGSDPAYDEPAWVAEFDPEFVDMFRGYVTFV
ncbi:uncharacterized protein C8A04DRAFT_34040 [Dichotomopilus funicola]|uniref:P-loop containing nucleoside triphosphate hydrolase protein n=1 Tax=Dichotomopilus funicola TaxID=1934379 RepID=A0AAN6ZQN6_9PEZI|nr:hypothetical protein C8A04DRAFT_34040 [Dichotomopilus funicola]